MGVVCRRGGCSCVGSPMDAPQVIRGHSFERVSWSREAEDSLAAALPLIDDRFIIACQVLEGIARLWKVDGGKSWMVTRVESPGPELVIVAYQGERCREVMAIVHAEATRQGIRNLRFHTQFPWLIEMFRDYDPMPMEYVVRVYCGKRNIYDQGRNAADKASAPHRWDGPICAEGGKAAPAP